MKRAFWILPFSLLLAIGCGPPEPPFMPVLTMEELMLGVMDPATDVLWASVGTIITAEETLEIYPRTDEEWEVVLHATMTMLESGNLLMIGERAVDDEGWMEAARNMIEVSKRALEAVASKDKDAVFDIGGEVYYACTACHEVYALDDEEEGEGEGGGDL